MIDKIIEMVRAKAAANPNAVYFPPDASNFCSYNKGDVIDNGEVISHGCIFGQVLKELGQSVGDYDGSIDNVLHKKFEPVFDRDDILWCHDVQSHQDDRVRWGDAVRLADEMAWIRKSREINNFLKTKEYF